jgi:hypothetical protein
VIKEKCVIVLKGIEVRYSGRFKLLSWEPITGPLDPSDECITFLGNVWTRLSSEVGKYPRIKKVMKHAATKTSINIRPPLKEKLLH